MLRILSLLWLMAAVSLAAAPAAVGSPFSSGAMSEVASTMTATTGVPFEELVRRIALEQAARPAVREIMAQTADYGGVAFDDGAGGWKLHVYYVGSVPSNQSDIEALVPDDLAIEWTQVERS
jgi:hypothetical protein